MKLPQLPTEVFDFTQLDRAAMLARLQGLVEQVNPNWVDFSPAFPENLILEAAVTHADAIRFMMEQRTRNFYLATGRDRVAFIRRGRLWNFSLNGATAPTLTGTFRLPNSALAVRKVWIQPWNGVQDTTVVTLDTSNPIRYRYKGATVLEIPVGANSVSASMEGCQTFVDEWESAEEANIELETTQFPCVVTAAGLPDAIVTAGNGTYEFVSSFMGQTIAGQNVTGQTRAVVGLLDQEGRLRLQFGNDIYGQIPSGTISAVYRVGGGEDSEVAANALWSIETQILNDVGQPVQVEFVNAAASSVASDAMSVEEARVLMPLAIRTNGRSITDDDYEYAAMQVSGIERAKLLTSNIDLTMMEDYGRLFVVARGARLSSGRYAAGTASAATLAIITTALAKGGSQPSHMGFRVDVIAAPTEAISITARVFKASGYTAATVRANIEAALADFFAVTLGPNDKDINNNSLEGQPNPSVAFGADFLDYAGTPNYQMAWSDLYNVVRDSTGVRKIKTGTDGFLVNSVQSDYTLQPAGWPVLGTLVLYDEDNSGVSF